jgi:hypothetical protein
MKSQRTGPSRDRDGLSEHERRLRSKTELERLLRRRPGRRRDAETDEGGAALPRRLRD